MKEEHKTIFRKILYAVETGSQIFGKAVYDAFVEAFTNSEKEYAITIGAGQWYGIEAKELLLHIQSENPQIFAEFDTENIESDLNNCDWNTYQLDCDSKKAECIRKIIGSDTGIKCQDALMDEQCEAYIREAIAHGVDNIQAQMMYGNIKHLGGTSAAERILSKMKKPYTLDGFYIALTTDQSDKSSDNQVGDSRYWSRHVKVYTMIKDYVYEDTIKGAGEEMKYTADNVIKEAEKWEGYLEKRSTGTDEQLKNKTWNVGSANITWFWTWLKRNGCLNLQGGAWCDGFVDYCHAFVAGVEKAKKSLNGFSGYTPTSSSNYKKAGRWIEADGEPKRGDQIFFEGYVSSEKCTRIYHTGIVTKVTKDTVYTIEGNTSSAAGVVENGGCVRKKSYKRNYSKIAGYGRPLYDDSNTTSSGSASGSQPKPNENNVTKGQKWLNDNYGDLIKKHLGALLATDGEYGKKSRAAAVCVWKDVMNRKFGFKLDPGNENFLDTSRGVAEMALIRKGDEGTLVYLAEFILSAKGFYSGKMDADYGSGLKSAVEAFQRSRGLEVDGVVGKNTWYALFN